MFKRVQRVTLSSGDLGTFTFDIALDDNGRMVDHHWHFGFRRDAHGGLYPCILKEPNGLGRAEIDFGAALAQTPDEYWRTDLRQRPLRIGETVAVWEPHGTEHGFRIDRVIDLIAG